MAKLKNNVSQAISDFNAIKASIENRGVEVGEAPTSEYAAKIDAIPQGGVDFEIEDASYLFYENARFNIADQLLSHVKRPTRCNSMFYSNPNKAEYLSWKTIDLSRIDFSACLKMDYMFYGCAFLEKLIIGDIDSSQVTTMASMFSNCQVLPALDLSKLDTGNVTTMKNMFSSCKALVELDLSNFDTGKVTDVCSMFIGCSKMQKANLSNWDTSKVTDMSYMFRNCEALTEIKGIEDFDTSNVKNVSGMFDKVKLESLNMSNWDTSKMTSMAAFFSNCMRMKELIGFSATNKAGITIAFPCGSSTVPYDLKRLTFRTDLPEGQYSIRSAINISYCAFDREGMVEMFNSLPDVSALGISSSYTKITITGNPCLWSDFALTDEKYAVIFHSYEEFCAYAKKRYMGFDHQNAPLKYGIGAQAVVDIEATFGDITEDMFSQGEVCVLFLADNVTVPEEIKLTDADRLIATNKGWTLVE